MRTHAISVALSAVAAMAAFTLGGCNSPTSTTQNAPLIPAEGTIAVDDGIVMEVDSTAPAISINGGVCPELADARTLVRLFVNKEVELAMKFLRESAGASPTRVNDTTWEWQLRTALTIDGHAQPFSGVLTATTADVGFTYTLSVTGRLRDRQLENFVLLSGSASANAAGGSWVIHDTRFEDGRTLEVITWNRAVGTSDKDGNFTLSHESVDGSALHTSRDGDMVTYTIALTGTVQDLTAGSYAITVNRSTRAGSMSGPDAAQFCWDSAGSCVACP